MKLDGIKSLKLIKMLDIGITEEMAKNPNIKIKGYFKGEGINWIIEVK